MVSGPCTASAITNVLVNAAPTASFVNPKTFFCRTSPSAFLNTTPVGGTFSGPGVSGNSFNPAQANVGNNNIVIYSYTDLNGCTDTASVRITVSACTAIEKINEKSLSFNIYPNPNSGSFEIRTDSELTLRLINELGELIGDVSLTSANSYTCYFSGLSPGIYYVMVKEDPILLGKKIVVGGN